MPHPEHNAIVVLANSAIRCPRQPTLNSVKRSLKESFGSDSRRWRPIPVLCNSFCAKGLTLRTKGEGPKNAPQFRANSECFLELRAPRRLGFLPTKFHPSRNCRLCCGAHLAPSTSGLLGSRNAPPKSRSPTGPAHSSVAANSVELILKVLYLSSEFERSLKCCRR